MRRITVIRAIAQYIAEKISKTHGDVIVTVEKLTEYAVERGFIKPEEKQKFGANAAALLLKLGRECTRKEWGCYAVLDNKVMFIIHKASFLKVLDPDYLRMLITAALVEP